jgi:two-component system, OmpR family, flagellar system response regulator FtcR
MLVLIDGRDLVIDGFSSLFKREGVCISGMDAVEFKEWFTCLSETDLNMIEAVLVGDCSERIALGTLIASRIDVPLFALIDAHRLEETLRLLDHGFDDVLRKPIHVREILARARLVRQRRAGSAQTENAPGIKVYLDGRGPQIDGAAIELPRRERRILEVLYLNAGRRISKAQLFSAVYGLDDETIEETVIESHISKLRKKLKAMLGYDPIDSQRFLGYCWAGSTTAKPVFRPSPAQAFAA